MYLLRPSNHLCRAVAYCTDRSSRGTWSDSNRRLVLTNPLLRPIYGLSDFLLLLIIVTDISFCESSCIHEYQNSVTICGKHPALFWKFNFALLYIYFFLQSLILLLKKKSFLWKILKAKGWCVRYKSHLLFIQHSNKRQHKKNNLPAVQY